MTARWYRSRLFWFGLAGLVMLLVAWMGFRKSSYSMEFGLRGHIFYGSNSPADLQLGYSDMSPFYHRGHDAITFDWRKAPHRDLVYDDMFGNVFYGEVSTGSVRFYIAIWAMAVTYPLLWICTLIWWQRRKQRLMSAGLPEM